MVYRKSILEWLVWNKNKAAIRRADPGGCWRPERRQVPSHLSATPLGRICWSGACLQGHLG